jgi:hypothetical protein
MKILFLILFSLLSVDLIAQNPFVGKWKCYHRELENGSTGEEFTFDGKPYSCNDFTLELKSDMTGIESELELTFSYEYNDSLLRIGNQVYFVELINSKELIIKDYKPNASPLTIFRQKFKKIEKSELK